MKDEQNELRHRKAPDGRIMSDDSQPTPPAVASDDKAEEKEAGCCTRLSLWTQHQSYNIMANTVWEGIIRGFKPGRIRAIARLDIQPNDRVLLVGEGSGSDFECLPQHVNKQAIRAFDFSPEMVKQCKVKAKQHGIPPENCFVGDAQKLPFQHEKFDKIFFPLSLASIPNPSLALQEAERVLAEGGKIVIFEKLMDDGATVSSNRRILNLLTNAIFADITRNLSQMLGNNSNLKIVHYEALDNKMDNFIARQVGPYYRVAELVRATEFQEVPAIAAKLK